MIWMIPFLLIFDSHSSPQLTVVSDVCTENLQAAEHPRQPLIDLNNEAKSRIEDIERSIVSLTGADAKLGEELLAAARAAVTKHQDVYLQARSLRNRDVGRHMEILRAIANFDPQRRLVSLYRLKAAIRGRYSIQEYIHCR